MLKLLERLISISREKGVKIEISFSRCRGRLLIDREVKALDEYGNVVPWNRAFPGIAIQNILDQCRVRKVEAFRGQEKVVEAPDAESAIRELSSLR
ncbi:MAG: hypothetical protein ACP5I3_04305 [Thermoproteus sp.]|uniref:Uncharacterized protein n=1 Tax=Thermoproteus uzoniensis (strain 768-20) TaxID=999630 RepID=F2L2L9_THEU7|nr:hypothetical protein [Thermoproteus uzoniensis]AEA13067.1 hypothetical protein TUZN_1600 [Thermoproteus uzoniensis 768-20]